MLLIEVLLCAAAVLALAPAALLLVQVLAAFWPYRLRAGAGARRPSAAILVPAHDEALLIGETLRSIRPQLLPGDRLLVVADNCSDDTASLAAGAGAEVIERQDALRRGKGYALDFGVRHLQRDPPEVVIVIDADCQVDAQAIDRLARLAARTGRPVQACYLMRSPEHAGANTRIAELAWLIKNRVRPLGYQRLGLPCQLMGAGMALPWPLLRGTALASGHLVEDVILGLDFARARAAPLFCPQALVWSEFPAGRAGMRSQRLRWEHGHLGVMTGEAPRLLVEAVRQRNPMLVAMLADLCVPPLTLLMLMVLGLLACGVLLRALGGSTLPLWPAAAALLMLVLAVLLSWARHGRQVISLSALACAPLYALWKLPIYLRFLVRRQVEWVRSRRG